MQLAWVVGLLFLAGTAYNLLGPEPDRAQALAGAIIGAVLIGLYVFNRVARGRDAAFHEWLTTNAQAITQGGARYRDVLITPATRVARFYVVLSFLVVSFKIPSRVYVVGHEGTHVVAVGCTVVSLLLGWWGVPWGPVYTVQAVSTNLRGGVKRTVGRLLL
jgi:hypothetical protein